METLPRRLLPIIAALSVGAFTCLLAHFPALQRLEQGLQEFATGEVEKTELPTLARIEITTDPERIFEASPPNAGDLALILSTLRKSGIERVILNHPLEDLAADPISLGLLEIELQSFEKSAISIPLTRRARPEKIPEPLQLSALGLRHSNQFPRVNALAADPVTWGGPKTSPAFGQLLSEEFSTARPPLVARWQKELFPSIELMALCVLTDQPPNQLRSGSRNTIEGLSSTPLAIDVFGRLNHSPVTSPNPRIKAEHLVLNDQPENLLMGTKTAFISSSDTSFRTLETLLLALGQSGRRASPSLVLHLVSALVIGTLFAWLSPLRRPSALVISLVVAVTATALGIIALPGLGSSLAFLTSSLAAGICCETARQKTC